MADKRMDFAKKLMVDDPAISDADLAAALRVFDAQQPRGPQTPAQAPQDMFGRVYGTANEVGKGILKGAGASVAGIGEMAVNAGMVPGTTPGLRHPLFDRTDELTKAENAPQLIGKGIETAAELAAPARAVGRGAAAIYRAGAQAFGQPLKHAAMSETPLLTQARKKVMGKILDWALPKPAAAPVPSSNAGGRMVQGQRLSVEDEIAAALDDLRGPSPEPSVQLPPQVTVAASATPRTSAPRITPKPAAATATETAPAPPKRAYFLKPESEIAPAATSAPRSSKAVTMAELPDAWKSHTGQDLFPVTGVEAKVIREALMQEIKDRGLSVGQALQLVSANKQIPTVMRAQIIRALSTPVRK